MLEDLKHSNTKEKRYFGLGQIDKNIMTVRFTYRNNKIKNIRCWILAQG
ncbi:MAG UNVERIFIED_CONTAM: BrnT family toxin [Rickettsiaceae bacterium]|jgi:uncharacterized DUF497 family protein